MQKVFATVFLLSASLLVVASAPGCGPSFQAVHDGEARFEHCYAIDETPSLPLEKKAECWNDWIKHYTYGQTRDRVQYAGERYQALSRVPGLPTDEAMMSAAPGEGVSTHTVAAPSPTNAFAPPPKTSDNNEGVDAGPTTGANANGNSGSSSSSGSAGQKPVKPAPAPQSPVASCASECETIWTSCRGSCTKACDECDRAYKACLKKCTK